MQEVMRLSVIIPARDEQQALPRLLDSIDDGTRHLRELGRLHVDVETVVVAHRCTDDTAAIARDRGAETVLLHHPSTVAGVRNVGALAARGDVFVTLDADTVLPLGGLARVVEAVADASVVGGAAREVCARRSLGIAVTMAAVHLGEAIGGLGGGMYWCRREDWHAVRGYNDLLASGSNHDFARRLREHGRHSGRRFVNLDVDVVASSRRYDAHGDWHLVRHLARPSRLWGLIEPAPLHDVGTSGSIVEESSDPAAWSTTSLQAL